MEIKGLDLGKITSLICQKARMWSTMRITSVIAENKPDAYHEPHLQVMKVVTILIPSFHGRR